MQARHWRRARQAVQILSFSLFTLMVLWTAARPDGWLNAAGLVSLDPLAGIAAMLSSRRFLLTFLPALLLIGLTLVAGRFWCGWLCPLGSLIEWTSPRKARLIVPRRWHGIKYSLLLLTLIAALLGSLTLLVLDPVTLFVRTVTVAIQPAAQWLVSRLQEGLYRTEILAGVADALDGLLRPTVLSYKQPYMLGLWPAAVLFVAVLLLNRIAPRFWCRYLCPLGGLLGLISKVSWLKRRVNTSCVACVACQRGCQMDAIDASRDYVSDSGECIQCLDCLGDCPAGSIEFAGSRNVDWGWEYDPSRRQALGMLGLGLAGVALSGVTVEAHHPQDGLLRPPGAMEDEFLSTCVRCGACLRVCPTHGLQMSLGEGGLAAVGTPILVPRLGQCDYTCNACGVVCPTGAIPGLTLEDKRLTTIGKAYVDESLCLPWSGRVPCIVCEEMCPLPEKAITLALVQAQGASGAMLELQAPVVNHERCIGCGLCENRCPVVGAAAIRVRVDPLA
jgi:MauM/NapG family ferredoxin protein